MLSGFTFRQGPVELEESVSIFWPVYDMFQEDAAEHAFCYTNRFGSSLPNAITFVEGWM
jgi:hypothetical protein